MGFLDQYGDEGASGEPSSREHDRTARRRTSGIWALAILNVLLGALAVLGILFVAAAQGYLVSESAEFGSEMEAAQTGLLVLRIAFYALTAGFVVSALGTISLTRIGLRLQFLWAVLLCLTLVGAVYGLPVLVFLRRGRARYFQDFVPAV